MSFHGKNFIGSELSAESTQTFSAIEAASGSELPGAFAEASLSEVEKACAKAEAAFAVYREKSGKEKATFLRAIATKIVALGDALVERTCAETGLPEARIQGERGRTCGQLNLFADLIEEGSWVGARIDKAQPERAPLPKPDLRYMERPLGPVAVFGASNFPLAFSTAGGDTASALAAGCPVVVKAHPFHPGCAELVAGAILEAAAETGMPEGVFSMIHSQGVEAASALVTNEKITAVGFTGSLGAGRAIFNACAARPVPIPVYAEMGSSNPVFVLPAALKNRGQEIAEGLAASVQMGAGQFCTNPGMTVAIASEETDAYFGKTAELLGAAGAGCFVHPSIQKGYEGEFAKLAEVAGVETVAQSTAAGSCATTQAVPAMLKTDAATYIASETLKNEVFGPSTTAVSCDSKAQMLELAQGLEGHLTATIFGDEEDFAEFADLARVLEQKVGRLIYNQYPTGVEVCPSMFHGGPYPASTDVRTTSVGTAAIHRFARPVSYQNTPQSLLPAELQDSNPLGINRLVDGKPE